MTLDPTRSVSPEAAVPAMSMRRAAALYGISFTLMVVLSLEIGRASCRERV